MKLRPAVAADRAELAAFLSFLPFIHRHLDWRPALDWLPHQPFWVMEDRSGISAVLACPPDPQGVGWIRIFACSSRFEPQEVFQNFLQRIQRQPQSDRLLLVSLAMQDWFGDVLRASDFVSAQKIVVLIWSPGTERKTLPPVPDLRIVPLLEEDLADTLELDNASFEDIWRFSAESLQIAYSTSSYATAALMGGKIVGYQLSNQSLLSAHLARIAVDPLLQGQGIAARLLADLLDHFARRGISEVTVNTQDTNTSSLSLYRSHGFRRTGEEYPVYKRYPLRSE